VLVLVTVRCGSSLSKQTAGEIAKSVVSAVTDVPALFDLVLQDVTSDQQDVQIIALQMLAACLNSDSLTRFLFTLT